MSSSADVKALLEQLRKAQSEPEEGQNQHELTNLEESKQTDYEHEEGHGPRGSLPNRPSIDYLLGSLQPLGWANNEENETTLEPSPSTDFEESVDVHHPQYIESSDFDFGISPETASEANYYPNANDAEIDLPSQAPASATFSPSTTRRDTRTLTYAQAIPLLGGITQQPGFFKKFAMLRKSQETLETNIAEERNRLVRSQQQKATEEGISIDSIQFKNERNVLERRALNKWDSLIVEQQRALQDMGVPAFYQTNDKNIRERQNKILALLIEMAEEEADDDDI